MLKPHFSDVRTLKYKSKLSFGAKDYQDLIDYFNFKHSFFIPEIIDPDDELHNKVAESIRNDLKSRKGLEITKNDAIFVCKGPLNKIK